MSAAHCSKSICLKSLNDTQLFAERLAALCRQHKAGIDISMVGDLGVGKTTLLRLTAQALQAQHPVSSPSFVLQHEYRCANDLLIEHWDLYRLRELPPELYEPPGNVRIVEWADRAKDFVEGSDLVIHIKFDSEGPQSEKRNIQLQARAGELLKGFCG